jgi:hypothetical protein
MVPPTMKPSPKSTVGITGGDGVLVSGEAQQAHWRASSSSLYHSSHTDTLNRTGFDRGSGLSLSKSRSPFSEDIEYEIRAAKGELSEEARKLLTIEPMKLLQQVPNSAMAGTRVFSQLSVNRGDHSVHAASLVSFLRETKKLSPQTMQLSDHELKVLEVALLFHDIGHVLGSHAVDKVFAAFRPDSCIGKRYYEGDYHELHGAQIVGKGDWTAFIRQTLGPDVFGDVMAVLTRKDTRPLDQKIETYGEYSPTLSEGRIKIIAHLEDKFDRASYVTLDYMCGGYAEDRLRPIRGLARTYVRALVIDDRKFSVELMGESDPYEQVIAARCEHFRQIPDHPINSLLAMVIRDTVGMRFAEFQERAGSAGVGVYEWLRDTLLNGDYEAAFGQECCDMLTDAEGCLSEEVAPVLMFARWDLNEAGREALDPQKLPEEHIQQESGAASSWGVRPLKSVVHEMSGLEKAVRAELQAQQIYVQAFFVTSSSSSKTFSHLVTVDGKTTLKDYSAAASATDVGREPPVVVFARAFDDQGNLVDLSVVRKVALDVIQKNGWVDNPNSLLGYDPLILVRPLDERPFSEEVVERWRSFELPKWLREGGCGLSPHIT